MAVSVIQFPSAKVSSPDVVDRPVFKRRSRGEPLSDEHVAAWLAVLEAHCAPPFDPGKRGRWLGSIAGLSRQQMNDVNAGAWRPRAGVQAVWYPAALLLSWSKHADYSPYAAGWGQLVSRLDSHSRGKAEAWVAESDAMKSRQREAAEAARPASDDEPQAWVRESFKGVVNAYVGVGKEVILNIHISRKHFSPRQLAWFEQFVARIASKKRERLRSRRPKLLR